MSLKDMTIVIELIDHMEDFREYMKPITGRCFDSGTFVMKMDKLYRLVENNLSDNFDIDDKNYYEKVICVVDNRELSAEDRARYVLTGEI
ncbi:MAG: hypothetical protein J6C01_11065 [Lachnospiraceae bacterium]|nr:hypothetical protein [Lachnospiraceae bacterium]